MDKDNQNRNAQSDSDALEHRARELEERDAALREKESQLEAQEEAVKRRMRDNLYDRIPLSVGTMNKIIIALVALLVVMLVLGITQSAG